MKDCKYLVVGGCSFAHGASMKRIDLKRPSQISEVSYEEKKKLRFSNLLA